MSLVRTYSVPWLIVAMGTPQHLPAVGGLAPPCMAVQVCRVRTDDTCLRVSVIAPYFVLRPPSPRTLAVATVRVEAVRRLCRGEAVLTRSTGE